MPLTSSRSTPRPPRALLLSLFALAAASAPARTTSWTITSTVDAVAADGACTLREAIRAAATDADVNECAAASASDEIVLRLSNVTFIDNGAESGLPGSLVIGGGLRASISDSVRFEGRRLVFDGNSVEAPGFVSTAGLQVLSSAGAAGSVVLEDVCVGGDALSGPAQSNTVRELNLGVTGAGPFVVRRVRSYGFSRSDDAALIGALSASNGATLIASDLLSVGGPPKGFLLAAPGAGSTLVAGNLTVVGQSEVGVQSSESSEGSLALENSILWGNGMVVANDVDVLVGEPEFDRIARRHWIGELGDPEPLFEAAGAGDFHLQESSEALDAGDATFVSVGRFDADHAPRVAGSALDLGAFERDALFGDGFESGDTAAWEAFDF